jgi:hypothetical protein
VRPELEDTLAAPASSDRTATIRGRTDVAATPGIPAGRQLGHFRIERPLGAGGMGEVYLATDLALDRPVAIKVLPEQLALDAGRRDRMIREARAQARIVHPNVGHIYFIGEDAGRVYFAMEYVAGQTLAERLGAGPLPVDEALGVIRASALGLREAQRHGFTHRDVKPSNLMIDGHGVVKVLDFGLAASAPSDADPDQPVAQTSLAGTPLYMAPEQARGGAVDFRADIYALGATLYHLVSGKPPFQADSVDELITLHASAARPAVPRSKKQGRTRIAEIDSLCSKMMAARPEDRFASYDELLRAIELASAEHTRPAGLWARTFAVIIDGIVVAVPVVIAYAIVESTSTIKIEGVLDALISGGLLLYHAVCTARWGRSAGKAVLELEVVDVDTNARPVADRAVRRSLALWGLPMVAGILEAIELGRIGNAIVEVAGAVLPLIAFALLVYATLFATGKRTLWDRAGRTMVRYRPTRPAVT